MGRFWLFAVAAIFAAAGAFAVWMLRPADKPAPADAAIGATIAVDPDATIAAQKGATLVARLTSPVHLGDLLATGPDGAIRVQFTDATFFSLGSNASARIDSYVFDPEHNMSGISMALQRGAFRFVSGPAKHDEANKTRVNTPVAAIGVRGTGFNVVIGPEAEALFRRIDRRYVPDGGDATTATLILLTDGAVDVDGSGQKIALEIPGQVLFFRRRGEPPIGPLMAWASVSGDIGALASPPALGPEPGASEPPAPPLPAASPTAVPSPKPSAVPSPRPSPSAVPSPRPTPTVRPTPTPTPKVTPRPTPRPTFTPRPTPTPRFTPRPSPIPTPRFTPRPTPRPTFTPRPTPTPRFTPRPTPTPRFTPRPTPTPRFTPRPTPTARFTPKPTPVATPRTRAPLTNVPRTRPSPTPSKPVIR